MHADDTCPEGIASAAAPADITPVAHTIPCRIGEPLRVPALPLSVLLTPWLMLRQAFGTRYRATPDYLVTFPAMAGRPGFTLRSYSRSPQRPFLRRDGFLMLGDVRVSHAGSRLHLSSAGHVSTVGPAHVVLQEVVARFPRLGFRPCGPLVTHVGGEPVWVASGVSRTGMTMTEVRWEHDGWVFGAGVVAGAAAMDLQEHVRTVLDSWTWLGGVSPSAPR